MSDLPLRMTAIEVCQLGRFSLATLTRKRRQDPTWLPSSTVHLSDREAASILRVLAEQRLQ